MRPNPAPSKSELVSLINAGVTLDQHQRVDALAGIMTWYETSIPFHRARFSPEDERKFQRAQKAAALGRGGISLDERETAMRTAIRHYEECLPAALALPKVAETLYKRIEEERSSLEALEQKKARELQERKARLKPELDALAAAFGALGIRFQLDPRAQSRIFDGKDAISYPPQHLEAARIPGYGALPLVISEMEAVLKASAVEQGPSGVAINPKKLIGNLGVVSRAILSWLAGQPAMADPKAAVGASPTPTPSPSPSPSPSGGSKKSQASTNPYRGMKAQLFEALIRNAGQRVHYTQINAGIGAKDPRRMLGHIAEDGLRTRRWSLVMSRGGWIDFNIV